MTNRLVHSLEGYVLAMFEDIKWTYVSVSDWERDLNRSLHELVIRGERFLTIDLPAIRKHLERCLEEGLYSASGLYLSGMVSKRVQVPAYCRDLYLQIFDMDGKLRSEPNVRAIADLRQLYEGFGKLKLPCKQEAIDDEVENFINNERDLKSPTLSWEDDYLELDNLPLRRTSFLDSFDTVRMRGQAELLLGSGESSDLPRYSDIKQLERVCDIISSEFGDFAEERRSERPKHGSGRVSNLRKLESKFDFSDWTKKLDRYYPYDRYAVSDLGWSTYLNDFAGVLQNHEAPSKLIAVPKTMSGPRLIGSEPNSHQWIQQLIRSQIEGRIKETSLRFCISFGDQEPNRKLALQGSIDGMTTTVDLKSASDRLSCWTVERALRANESLLHRIHASRTRWMRNAINDRFSFLKLKKCFTQGSACTFPVQTVVYSMFAITSVILTDGLSVNSSNIRKAARKVRVFGDDIIVPTNALPKLLEILSFTQLKVNLNKTFSKGKFRESCGLDAYDGVDVTPARVKRFSSNPSHEVAESMVEASNNFYKRGMWNVANWLRYHLRKVTLPIVQQRDSDRTIYGSFLQKERFGNGFQCFQGKNYSHLKSRWNNFIHTQEYLVHRLTSKSEKVPTQSAYDLMEFLSTSKSSRRSNLDHLSPKQGGLGVVHKQSSVMRRGWSQLA